jgi:hypothetical protein
MRGWVCRLQLLLVLASAVIFRSESRWTHDHMLLSQIRDSPQTWRARPPNLHPPATGWLSYSQELCSFSVACTTRRASTRVSLSRVSAASEFGVICTAAFMVSRILGRCLLLVRIPGDGRFRSNGLVSTNLHLFICVFMDTFVKYPAMVCVQESYIRGNLFANSFHRNDLNITIIIII